MKIEAKVINRLLLFCGCVSIAALIFHAIGRADRFSGLMVPVAALLLGGFAAGFIWLVSILHADQTEKAIPGFSVFVMKAFVCVGAIGWACNVMPMFTLDPQGGEAAVGSFIYVCLATTIITKILRKTKRPNSERSASQQPTSETWPPLS